MDININVTLDSGTTKAVALLAESILAAASELNRTAVGTAATLAVSPEPPAAEATPPKKTRKPRGKPAAKPAAEAAPATENEEPASAPDPAPAADKVTREVVRKAAGAFLEAGKDRADVKEWLAEFGAESITTLGEKHLVEMHSRLTA